MAWTWSAPQRGTVAAWAAIAGGQRFHNLIRTLGRGDTTRGLSIASAAFLTTAGMAAPHIPENLMTALLFLSGAALLGYAAMAPSSSSPAKMIDPNDACPASEPAAERRWLAPACLTELLAARPSVSVCDRAEFARLTAHMSHEMRTPLNAIIGFSEMMSNEVFGPLGASAYSAYARDIHASGMSLLKSADDALAITTLLTLADDHKSQLTNAAAVIDEALLFHAGNLASRGLDYNVTSAADAELVADPHAVRQLLINLLTTVTEQATQGSKLSIETRIANGQIGIHLTVTKRSPSRMPESFSLLLARTLSQLSGARLTIDANQTDEWRASVCFSQAAQNDLFAAKRQAANECS